MDTNELRDLPLFRRSRESDFVPQIKRWTVTELTAQIRGVIEPAFTQVWVQGEISNYRPAASGHVYFSLKDQGACVSAAVFGWGLKKKAVQLKDGIQILCRGKVTLYPPRGSYQLIIDYLEPLGAGALQAAFERLKAKLVAEGLFDQSQKRMLPRFPKRISIITSPTGAVIQDILTVLRRRAPHIHVTIIPVPVQGGGAAAQIIRALELANGKNLGELVVLARGGGSIEDLWCFNDEDLARSIRNSNLPVISAVGHETDFTIADFVADLRAPTPSAAAEILSSHWTDAGLGIHEISNRLRGVISRQLMNQKNLLTHIAARLVSPKDRLREQAQRVDDITLRLERAIKARLDKKNGTLEQCLGKLDALSPLRVLNRGYTLVRDPMENSIIIKSVRQVRRGQELEITFCDGQRIVQVL